MARVSWTNQALADVDEVCSYIARSAPRTAKTFGQRIFAAVERLNRFPLAGQIVPEIGRNDIREIRLQRYRIVYRVLEEENEILTVYHSARLLDPSVLGEE